MGTVKTHLAACLAVALGIATSAQGETRTLWPLADAPVPVAATSGVSVAVADGAAHIAFKEGKWRNVLFPMKGASRDFSPFARLYAAVSNETASSVEVKMVVLSVGGGHRDAWFHLPPHGAGILSASLQFMEALDKPLEFEGMGYKWPVAGAEKTFDPERVEGVQFVIAPAKGCERISVLRIEAGGRASPRRVFAADGFFPFVDRFGQFVHEEWSGKVHGVADLRAARKAEVAALAGSDGGFPDRDKWGGWLGGPQLEATGAFRTEKVDGKWWLVDPDGRLFWSHGVCCVAADGSATRVGGRERYFPKAIVGGSGTGSGEPFAGCRSGKPAERSWNFYKANVRLKYADAPEGPFVAFAKTARARLGAWGLNTMGNWSSPEIFLGGGVPYTVNCTPWLPPISGGKGYFPDPFDESFVPRLEDALDVLVDFGIAEDPWCVGIFVNNEMSFGSDDLALARRIIESPAKQSAKREMMRLAQEKYGEVEALNAAWGTNYASWDDALASTALPDETRAGADMAECHRLVCEAYFSRVADAIRRKAPGRLYLGSRFAHGFGGAAFRAAARHCDVTTYNIYKPLPVPEQGWEEDFPDRPMLVGEFCFQGVGRGYGNWGYEPDERAAAYRRFLEHALRDPRCVGAHWFQWADQPHTGRFDGENYFMGLVDICDTPHPEMAAAAQSIGKEMYPLRNGNN